MEEIITIDKHQCILKSSAPLTQAQRIDIINKLSGKLNNSTYSLGAANCITTPIKKGTTKNIPCTAQSNNANPNFTYVLSINGTEYARHSTGVTTSPNAYTFPNVPFNTAGSIPVSLIASDGCSGGTSDTASCTITVQESTLNTVTLSGCTSSIQIDQTCTLTATCGDQFNTPMSCGTLTWTTSNASIAAVNTSGLVAGISAGIATITATSANGKSGSKLVTVTTIPCTATICGFTLS